MAQVDQILLAVARRISRWLGCEPRVAVTGVIFSLGLASAALGQASLDTLIGQISTASQDPAASLSELQDAREAMNDVVARFPNSPAARAIQSDGRYQDVNFTSIVERLAVAQSLAGFFSPVPEEQPSNPAAFETCLNDTLRPHAGTDWILRLSLATNGSLGAMPVLLAPDMLTARERINYYQALNVIETCAQYPVLEPSGPFEITITSEGEVLFPDRSVPTALDSNAVALPRELPAPIFSLVAADVETEAALQLTHSDRKELQHRLRLGGHDPGGADGNFGRKSRGAISSWQSANRIQATGFFNETQIELLRVQTDVAYEKYKKTRPKRRRVKVCGRAFLGLRTCRYEYRYYR